MESLPDPVQYAIPAFVLLVIAEIIHVRSSGRGRYEARDTLASLLMGAGNAVIGALMAGVLLTIGNWFYQYRLLDIGYAPWAWVACFVIDDFLYYAFHRVAHRCRWFWASHVIHHSSQHYNLSTALRQTWTGNLGFAFAFRLPLFVIGFPPAMVFFCGGLNLIYQFWIHTEAVQTCPRWFEAIFNTPSHHRVHHATNPRYLDANYAGVFILWDRVLGTFVLEDASDPCRYGLVANIGTFNPLRIAFHEWVAMARDVLQARSLPQIAGFLFRPPGWTPDGSRLTSDIIKARWRATSNRTTA